MLKVAGFAAHLHDLQLVSGTRSIKHGYLWREVSVFIRFMQRRKHVQRGECSLWGRSGTAPAGPADPPPLQTDTDILWSKDPDGWLQNKAFIPPFCFHPH